MDRKKLKKINIQRKILLFLIGVSTLFMSIGYASINSIILNVNGDIVANIYDGVLITDVTYKENVNANQQDSKIINYYETMLESSIVLTTDPNSTITYTVTIYNNSNQKQIFSGVTYDNEYYSNENIIFNLSGLEIGKIIESKETISFDITFKYVDAINPTEEITILNSYLKFEFNKFNEQIIATYNYRGEIDTFIAPKKAIYKIEVWGAQGGSTGGNDTKGVYQEYRGGYGGYSSGYTLLNENQEIYIAVGGQGTGSCVETACIGGYNGGGNSGVSTEDTKNFTCSGGGATHVATTNRGLLVNYENYRNEILLVAGGGAGGYYHEFGEKHSIVGAAGGGITGIDGALSQYEKDGINIVAAATGGTQTSGGIGGYRGANGSFGQGGSGASCNTTDCGSSGGGGGYYGGGAAGHSGAGGGSGYIDNIANGTTIADQRAGAGYAKITLIETIED